jgi:hypothetical protein
LPNEPTPPAAPVETVPGAGSAPSEDSKACPHFRSAGAPPACGENAPAAPKTSEEDLPIEPKHPVCAALAQSPYPATHTPHPATPHNPPPAITIVRSPCGGRNAAIAGPEARSTQLQNPHAGCTFLRFRP